MGRPLRVVRAPASARDLRLAAIQVEPVRTPRDRDTFVQFQLDLYKDDPYYVPPIVAERRDFLDRSKNPFLAHAEIELFLARKDGQVVGRIAAIDDPAFNQFHDAEVGWFGMFDSVDDPAVAGALFDAAGRWVASRGMKKLQGPANLSLNHDCGVLVEGFDSHPAMLFPYNARYYPKLLETNGFTKAKDLWTWEIATSLAAPEKAIQAAEKVRRAEGIHVRSLDVRNLSEEIRRFKGIYDAMLERHWGFVPMTDEEFEAIALRLKPLVTFKPELVLIAEVRGEPVACSVTLPDANVAIKAAGGHLTNWGLPVGLAKMAWAARNIDRVRVLMLGVKPAWKKKGVDQLLFLDTMRAARDLGYEGGEIGWMPEDQDWLNRSMANMGARRFKTYRIYQRPL